MTGLPIPLAILAIIISGITIFLQRLFPFALFSKKDPPPLIHFIEKYMPSLIIAILIVYTLKDIEFASFPYGAQYFVSIAITAVLHILFKNSFVSIFGGTVTFMVLQHFITGAA